MGKDLNSVNLIGRLVRDPEIRYTASGTAVAKISIANNYSYMQNNDRKDEVNYFDINVWGNSALNCEKYLKKGNQVAITGELRQNRWTDQASGQTRSKIEITAINVQFIGPANQNNNQNSGQGNNYNNQNNYRQQPQQNNYNNGVNKNNQQQQGGYIQDPWANQNNNQNGDNDDDIPF